MCWQDWIFLLGMQHVLILLKTIQDYFYVKKKIKFGVKWVMEAYVMGGKQLFTGIIRCILCFPHSTVVSWQSDHALKCKVYFL